MKHTPGPWDMCGPYKEGGYLNCGFLITTGYNVNPPEPEVGLFDGREPLHGPMAGFTEADASLIAAAPELLEALRALLKQAEVASFAGQSLHASPSVLKARALLAKVPAMKNAIPANAGASGPTDQPEYQYPSIDDVREERTKYREQRDELLEALRECLPWAAEWASDHSISLGPVQTARIDRARAILAKVQS